MQIVVSQGLSMCGSLRTPIHSFSLYFSTLGNYRTEPEEVAETVRPEIDQKGVFCCGK